ncbi:MAG: flagellar M-ring protein FliF [Firmicutes bacterium HGW-Firmicutes-13]|nr:MAG: flagellar M-ring protein FliF [Firmicutes bacterium HGW-Firmicutes-13]
MLEKLNNNLNLEDIKKKWQNAEKNKKVGFVILLCCVLIAFYFIGYFGMKQDYAPLFTGLEPGEAGKIVSSLKDRNVPYKITNEGTGILVPKNDVYELRLDFASEGLLYASGSGFELFDQTRLGATDFERRLNFQRALQEELRRTICQIGEVEQARIHLVMPEPTVFIEEAGTPTAAVFLKLKPLKRLEKQQVRAIVNLVAGSVENLLPEGVTVIDSEGNVISDELGPMDPSWVGSELALKHLEIKKTYEKELENRIQKTLEKVYGPGKVVAMVSAELDFDAQESTSVTYGTEAVPRSHIILEESYSGSGSPPGEVGIDSNVPGYLSYYSSGNMEYERREESIQNEINEIVQREIKAPGKVERISTAVIVDNSATGFVKLAEGRPPEEEISVLVSTAIGLDPERGDTINVQMMSFNTELTNKAAALMQEMAEESARDRLLQRYVLGGLFALVFLSGTIIVFKRRKRAGGYIMEEEVEVGVKEIVTDEIKPESKVNKTHKKVKNLAENNPEEVVQLIRTWMVGE